MGLKFEKKRSLAFLKELEREIRRVRPLSPRERLEKKLRKAVRRENYELAARLRDRIAELRREHAPSKD
jgi:protein-arginine kinase activator protein McsA